MKYIGEDGSIIIGFTSLFSLTQLFQCILLFENNFEVNKPSLPLYSNAYTHTQNTCTQTYIHLSL